MEKADKPKLEGGLSDLFKSHNESMDRLQEGNYYLIAMLDSYFSLLEHAFVLLLPFLDNKELGEVNMETFIGYNWKDKYKAIFPLTSDKEVWQLLERLDKIKEQLRNPLTHGYFLKKGNSFYAHMDHLGAIPVTLTKTNNKLKYFFGAITPLTFKEICKCFDDCDEFLSNHSLTKFGMQYIKSGLSVAFDKSSSNKYRSAMVSQELFDQFIDYIGCQQDDAANMDW